jgi:hypothetical protein
MNRIIVDGIIKILVLKTTKIAEESLWQSSAKNTNVINVIVNSMT